MMRRVFIMLTLMLPLALPVMPQQYEPFQTSGAQAPSANCTVGMEAPDYVTAQSGDLDPFGASSRNAARRRKPPSTGGDPTNPDIPAPIDGAVWVLLVLAVAYAVRSLLERLRC